MVLLKARVDCFRAKSSTASSASSRLIAANLKAVGRALNFTLSAIGHPPDNLSQKLPCLTYGVQSSTVTVIPHHFTKLAEGVTGFAERRD